MLKRKKKEYNIYGRIVLKFNDDYTLAHRGDSVQLKDTFTKIKRTSPMKLAGTFFIGRN